MNTDFWRETHYGFTRDSGHFCAFEAAEPFTAQPRVQASFDIFTIKLVWWSG
jgi:regulation of enolase protein 1 (concanavalin A-like superfamily)